MINISSPGTHSAVNIASQLVNKSLQGMGLAISPSAHGIQSLLVLLIIINHVFIITKILIIIKNKKYQD